VKKVLFILVSAGCFYLYLSSAVIAEEGCRTGAVALGNAFIRSNAIYAYYFGTLESYVARERVHFVQGGDSIRCAKALSQALLKGAIRNYDPNALRRKEELNARLGAMGISPGPAQPSASQQLYTMALQLDRLARVLPPAAAGDYEPLRRPTTELEQMQMFSAQMLSILLQDPMIADIFRQMEPMIRDVANLDYQILVGMALNLAGQ